MLLVWLKPSSEIKVCRETKTSNQRDEERTPLPDGRDGLAGSFRHIANQNPSEPESEERESQQWQLRRGHGFQVVSG